jgi:serine/threonine-protein kinase
MTRIPMNIVFFVMIIGALVFILGTTIYLPPRVGITFGGSGLAHNFMNSNDYRIYLLVYTIGLPSFIVAMIGWLPKQFPDKINIPDRDYWLAPQNREDTLLFLSEHAYRLGCLMIFFMLGIQWLVIKANQQDPPKLDNVTFIGFLIGFFISMVLWIISLFFRFRRNE